MSRALVSLWSDVDAACFFRNVGRGERWNIRPNHTSHGGPMPNVPASHRSTRGYGGQCRTTRTASLKVPTKMAKLGFRPVFTQGNGEGFSVALRCLRCATSPVLSGSAECQKDESDSEVDGLPALSRRHGRQLCCCPQGNL